MGRLACRLGSVEPGAKLPSTSSLSSWRMRSSCQRRPVVELVHGRRARPRCSGAGGRAGERWPGRRSRRPARCTRTSAWAAAPTSSPRSAARRRSLGRGPGPELLAPGPPADLGLTCADDLLARPRRCPASAPGRGLGPALAGGHPVDPGRPRTSSSCSSTTSASPTSAATAPRSPRPPSTPSRRRPALLGVPHHRHVLDHPGRAADRAQPPQRRRRVPGQLRQRLPGYRGKIARSAGTLAEMLDAHGYRCTSPASGT